MIFNVSIGKQNYSQRRAQLVFEQKGKYGTNIISWKNTCNVHSLSMSLLYSGWIFPASDYKREPDSLGAYILHECLKENNFYKICLIFIVKIFSKKSKRRILLAFFLGNNNLYTLVLVTNFVIFY